MTKITEAQTRAKKKWEEKNRAQSNYIKSRSAARSFIKNKATLEDLIEFEELMKQRKEEITQQKKV